jgi:hypothetical protein
MMKRVIMATMTYVIETRDNQGWSYDGICTTSLSDCTWETAEEAEFVVHDLRSQDGDWADADYRIVEVALGGDLWPGYTVARIVETFERD